MAAEGRQKRDVDIAVLAAGAVFHGVYEVVRTIKAGGMGAVYEVLQKNTDRRRALKVMLPSLVSDPEMRARFELEAKVAAGIESEHIVETLDAGIDEATGMPFIVMELLKGEELGSLLKARRRLPPDEVVTLLHQAALALDRTHAAGIIHRDLKPENLFLTRRDDGSPRLKILDFGVAKIVADGTATSNTTKSVGSPLYMAPEQILGDLKIGPGVDRYSLAHIAFTMVVGRPYWARERKASQGLYPYLMLVAKGAQVQASERAAELGVSLPPAFDTWFAKATALDPDSRFDGSVEQVAAFAEVFGLTSPAALAPPSRAILPSIVLDTSPQDGPVSAPPSSAAMATAPAQTVAVPGARKPPPEEPAPEPPSSTAEPSTAALTRSSEVPKRRSSFAPVVALLVLGAAAVGGAFVYWPRAGSALAPASSAAPTETSSPRDVVPAALSEAPPPALPAASSSVASPVDEPPSPAASASASAALPQPEQPPTVASTAPTPAFPPTTSTATTTGGALPAGGTKPSTPRPTGKNPLDEY